MDSIADNGHTEKSKLLPRLPQLDPSVTSDGAKRTLSTDKQLDNQAWHLLSSSCERTKADCKGLIEAVLKHTVSEEDILDGRVNASGADINPELINPLSARINEDIYTINNFVGDAQLPKSQYVDEEKFLADHWKLVKDSVNAAKIDLPIFNKLDTGSEKTKELLHNVESIYQFMDDTQGEVSRLSNSDRNNWRAAAEKETMDAMAPALQATLSAIRSVNQAGWEMSRIRESDSSGPFGDLGRGPGRFIMDLHPIIGLADLVTTGFSHMQSAGDKNKH